MSETYRFEGDVDGEAFRVVRQPDGKATGWMPNEEVYHPEGGQLNAEVVWQLYWAQFGDGYGHQDHEQ